MGHVGFVYSAILGITLWGSLYSFLYLHRAEMAYLQTKLSSYAASLDATAKDRYTKKISTVGVDPYLINKSETKSAHSCTSSELPDLTYFDMYHYLINTPGGYSGQSLKAYKSLDAYKYFSSGWVQDVFVNLRSNRFIICSQVCQLLN